jgi:hypothetical protein
MAGSVHATAPLTDAFGAATTPLTDVAASTPLTGALGTAATPIADAVHSTSAPVVDTAPVVNVVASAAAPVTHAVPLDSGAAPVVEPIAHAAATGSAFPDAVASVTLPAANAADGLAQALPTPAPPEWITSAPGLTPGTTPLSDAAATATETAAAASNAPDAVAAVSSAAATPPPVDFPATTPAGTPMAAATMPSPALAHEAQPHSELSALPIDHAFPFDASVIAHGLGTWEARFMIAATLSGLIAGRAAGVGMIDFAQPVLQACNVSVRAAFSQVRLVPCDQASRGVRSVVEKLQGGNAASTGGKSPASRSSSSPSSSARGSSSASSSARGSSSPSWSVDPGDGESPAEAATAALRPFFWSVPEAGGMLLRVFAGMLASVSAMIAGRAGVRRHSRDRHELPYRRRLDS